MTSFKKVRKPLQVSGCILCVCIKYYTIHFPLSYITTNIFNTIVVKDYR